ncbi:MAG: hypothetical protein M5U28_40980 [Sandaracinaceae bacterium]|nr:hypothetical protein [Sandaracinaceae bacterium]
MRTRSSSGELILAPEEDGVGSCEHAEDGRADPMRVGTERLAELPGDAGGLLDDGAELLGIRLPTLGTPDPQHRRAPSSCASLGHVRVEPGDGIAETVECFRTIV